MPRGDTPRKKKEKKDEAASSNRDMNMKDEEEADDDNLFFVEDPNLDEGYDLSDIVNWDVPELEKITYVFVPTVSLQFSDRPRLRRWMES